jgi:SAM-dependent methyltransferase
VKTANQRQTAAESLSEIYRHHHEGSPGPKRYGFAIAEEARAAWLRLRVGASRDVLDLGCRDGTLTRHFALQNRVVGIDIDVEALAAAGSRLDLSAIVADLNRPVLPLASRAFDVVVAGEVLEHVQFPDMLVAEVRRVLRPGGVFLGSVPNAYRLRNRLLFLRGRQFETDPTHLHWYSRHGLRALLGAHFTGIELGYAGGRRAWLSGALFAESLLWMCRPAMERE